MTLETFRPELPNLKRRQLMSPVKLNHLGDILGIFHCEAWSKTVGDHSDEITTVTQ